MKRQLAGRYALLTAFITIGLPSGVLAAQEQDMTQIHITMGGTPGAEFSAEWRITQNDETIEHPEVLGTVPAEFTFEGTVLEGTVKLLSDDERLEVDIVKGSNRSRSSTQGKGGTLTVVVR
ncbi:MULTISPECIES: hypothetical protein [unclassified Halomonas]|uniref:hypothetical protein n=1 Tax=unclassified Halomonas TaxID=2609666 RepID=UPI0009905EDF|nr:MULTISPECIES: hypothetical protein [unclassified Halomonas]AQU84488.1 hypothetical protein B2G49_18980 [Halomonas sp. 'Soap Lake \